MRKGRSGHADIYYDFENTIRKFTNWIGTKEPNKNMQGIFYRYFLKKFNKPRKNHLNYLPSSNNVYFALLSGIEYSKIFLKFLLPAKKKIIFQFDTWTHDNIINENAYRFFGVNIAFLTIKKSVDYFNSLNIPYFKAYWIPEAVDSNSYKSQNYDDKDIDVLQYGRRWEWLHHLLVSSEFINKYNYKYPKNNLKQQFKKREDLVDALSRSKIVICVPKSITNPSEYDLETITTRYFEVFSSKALAVGVSPKELTDLFGYNPLINIDKNDPVKQIDELLNNYSKYIPLIEKNYNLVLQKHQWSDRLKQMINLISE